MVVEVLVVGWDWFSDSKLWTSILEMILLNMTNFLGPLVRYVASQTRMFLRPPSFSQRFVVKVQHL